MKGVIFNLLEDFMTENINETAFDEVLEKADIEETHFIGPKVYPDESFLEIFVKACKLFSLNSKDTQIAFGKFCFPILHKKIGHIVKHIHDFPQFIDSVDSIIHVEVNKIFPGAKTPKLITKHGKDIIEIEYHSERNLCYFMHGLVEAALNQFGRSAKMHQSQCKHDGAEFCNFVLEF